METYDRLPIEPGLQRKHSISIRRWFRSGDPWIWLSATAVGVSIVAVVGLITLIAWKGLTHFWPADVHTIEYHDEWDEYVLVGEIAQRESISRDLYQEFNPSDTELPPGSVRRWMMKTGNRKVNAPDFRWIDVHLIESKIQDPDMVVFERSEWGNAYGTIVELRESGQTIAVDDLWSELKRRVQRASSLRNTSEKLQKRSIDQINYQLERLRLQQRKRELRGNFETADLNTKRSELIQEYELHEQSLREIDEKLQRDQVVIRIANGSESIIELRDIERFWRPNSMSFLSKFGHYVSTIWNFLTQDSREANTEGGIFPALFGTILMVILMSILVTPFGVIAAVYLREYARQGTLVRLIRIAVNNLAGVPSIVYGVFGLGFFVYLIGGTIDDLFFEAAKPAPTFGTPGLIWASLTLALLTVPVVIVSTEEGLTRIPSALREGSLALGATKAETLFKVVMPMASPAMLTGVILAIARAAGEVAPLMLVGVVKLAPSLPIDGNFPFLHLDRKFMHLGFHIYDVGFQSPNVDAVRPLVFATALLLILIIIVLNLTAILLRNRLEARYREALQ